MAEIENIEGKVIAFFDGSDVRFALVTQQVKDKMQLVNETGRNFKIPYKTFLCAFDESNKERFLDSVEGLRSKLEGGAEEVETEMLWEMLSEDPTDYDLNGMAENYFSEADNMEKCSLFQAVAHDSVRFKRKGLSFTPRPEKQVEEQLLALKKKQEKEERIARITPWLKEQLKNLKGEEEAPEEFLPFLQQLEVNLYHRKKNEASELLATLLDKQTVRRVIFDILRKFNIIDKNDDQFLVLAGIDERFSQRVLADTEEIPLFDGDDKRRSLNGLYSFSIDDEETRDIDDALSVEFLDDRTRVGIHIADVSHYIRRNDPLDKEAASRVTSIYLPSRTVNMFPPRLSLDLASLLAGETRPSMTFWADFNAEGEMFEWKVEETVINVTRRLSYNHVDKVLAGEVEDAELLDKVKFLDELARDLQQKRLENGAAVFNKPELKIRVKDDEVSVKEGRKDSASRFLVSEYMVLGNCIASLYAVRNDMPLIYRTQDKPEGLPELDPNHYDPVLFDKAIRCMKRSRLSLHPSEHGGLGVDFYTQMTSPIRRFTDLVLQRQLSAHLRGETLPYEADELMAVLANAESIGSEVKTVQRSAEDYWLHEFIKREMLKTEVEATVTGKIQGAYLVELDGTYNRVRLSHADKLEPGQRVLVHIDKVNPQKGFVDVSFKVLLEEEI